MTEIKPIRLAFAETKSIDEGSFSLDGAAYSAAAARLRSALASGGPQDRTPGGIGEKLGTTDDFVRLCAQLDTDFGADATLPLADAEEAVEQALRALAEVVAALDRLSLVGERMAWQTIIIGVGLWAMRHRLAIFRPEPIVNALAERANEAQTRQDTVATFALMQGLIDHLAPQLGMDLERSNPERPWRLLNLNFAIAAIRTGDAEMMQFAFANLKSRMPQECAGFFAEAASLAADPGFPAPTRTLIEAELARSVPLH
ncbi:MAG: hypothetical protein HY255_10885 [Betaproteobacteria bacterium]|nr:hypothetical protein [Betaproteobacteria bacterium]